VCIIATRLDACAFLPARWTSVVVPDPFVLIGADRAHFRLEDLIRLHDRVKELQG
jgi:hypothetical protein